MRVCVCVCVCVCVKIYNRKKHEVFRRWGYSKFELFVYIKHMA